MKHEQQGCEGAVFFEGIIGEDVAGMMCSRSSSPCYRAADICVGLPRKLRWQVRCSVLVYRQKNEQIDRQTASQLVRETELGWVLVRRASDPPEARRCLYLPPLYCGWSLRHGRMFEVSSTSTCVAPVVAFSVVNEIENYGLRSPLIAPF